MSNPHPTKTGAAANPNGRPRHKPIADALRHLLMSAKVTKSNNGKTFKVPLPSKPRPFDYVAQGILEDAINRDDAARHLLLERTEGKVPQPIAGSDDPSDPPVKLTRDTISVKEAARILGNLLLTAELNEKENAG